MFCSLNAPFQCFIDAGMFCFSVDLVITVKRGDSSSDEDGSFARPTVSNLSELTVIMSAMEDAIGQFL